MAKDLSALKAAIKLVSDAVNDSVKPASGDSPAAKLVNFQNLIPDILDLLPKIGDIGAEVNGLSPADYGVLLGELAADLAMPNAHVGAIVTASIKLLEDIVQVILPDVQALIAAAQAAPQPVVAGPAPVVPAP